MKRKVSLKNRMLFGYAAPICVYLGVAGLVYSTATQVFDTFEEVERVQKVLVETNNISYLAQVMIGNVRGYLISRNPDFKRDYQESIKTLRQRASVGENLIRNTEQLDRFRKMVSLIDNYEEYAREIIQLMDAGQTEKAVNIFKTGQATKFVQEFEQLNRDFEKNQREIIADKTLQANQALRFLLTALWIGSFLLISLSIIIAFLISSGISNIINSAIGTIASSSTQIAATVEEQERNSSQQASSVHETTTTMDELGASSRHAAEQAEVSAENARQLLKLAESSTTGAHQVLNQAQTGTQFVAQTMEQIIVLKDKVEAIAQHINHLNQQANQINSITDLVSNVANQTNMLALNAAVEAVRAGEHGKGFGIVATEIRKLADQSKQSAEKINLIIEQIKMGINLTVNVTSEGVNKAEESIKLSRQTSENFITVAQAINDIILNNQQVSLSGINKVVESCQQISLTAKQQAIAIEQVVEAMNAINQGAAETATGISQTKIGTQKLNEAAIYLKEIL
ncbi:methyl-accepting chemotaxis protein [Ancylothrix sp. C2]|uniref:methyl-accepting chemotaxis protein n=1 Tax=Ancylothrix sp. D3o TaxID=2953691 RepID=UPI0021BA76AD|nr:methyl-accepting chemotaxis protein [Ancylothrix sp. D3o]MCT7949663.1 methyl-accepting chemotaxis protein [Ancylothrix sp. D3o]